MNRAVDIIYNRLAEREIDINMYIYNVENLVNGKLQASLKGIELKENKDERRPQICIKGKINRRERNREREKGERERKIMRE